MGRALFIAGLVSLLCGHQALAVDFPNLMGTWKAEKASLYSSPGGFTGKADISIVVRSQQGSEFEGNLGYVTPKENQGLVSLCGTISADGKRIFTVSKHYVGQGDINSDGSIDLYLLKTASDTKAINLHLVRAKAGGPPAALTPRGEHMGD